MRHLLLIGALLLLTGRVEAETTKDKAVEAQPQVAEDQTWGSGKTIMGKEAPGYVAFTFDDGPNLETTPRILDTLERYEVPATFFVVGRHFAKETAASRAGSDLLRDMAERGFTIGNHTSEHKRLDRQPLKSSAQSIDGNARAIERLLGVSPRLFRPPFGIITARVRRLLRDRNNTLVRWNIDPRDFQRNRRQGLRKRVTEQILAKSGGVVLLHDTKPWTAEALPGILEDLEKANCRRLAAGQPVILPVSLHYFMRNPDGAPRPIPPEVLNTTQRTIDSLSKRCQKDN